MSSVAGGTSAEHGHGHGHDPSAGHLAHEDEHYVQQSLWELTGNVSCGRRIFLGDVIMDAAPFLYPFLIEYSLIGAAVLYVIWTHIGLNPKSVSALFFFCENK